MIGTTLAHYRILEKLGEGGVGEVYLAEDTELRRQVALKVLRAETAVDEDHLARFQREARAVAALNHPNIVTIHSVERAAPNGDDEPIHFLTMELVDGVGLDHKIPADGLEIERIFELAIPLADALAAAHKQGITHRDLKPANVMLTSDGRVKILDFGLAKLTTDEGLNDNEQTVAQTQTGMVMGTVPYMSPEQVTGGEVDHRTDIFALGVILYEMATGHRPFRGESSAHLISSILRDDPPSVTELRHELPFHLGRIVRRCLEKKPDRRYQSALDVRNELDTLRAEMATGVVSAVSETIPVAEPPKAQTPFFKPLVLGAIAILAVLGSAFVWWLARGRAVDSESGQGESSRPPSVVVLPFDNLGAPEDEYFARGITEEINSHLATVPGLRVISHNSALRYAEAGRSLGEMGAELEVDHVLDGSVRWAKTDQGSRVRITPRLTRIRDDSQIWSATYDRVLADVFEVQDEIADSVTEELGISLLDPGSGSEAEERPTENTEAYQAYLRALDKENDFGLDNQLLTLQLLERATELDPGFAQAWARLAWKYSNLYFNGNFYDRWLPKADAALQKALELAPEDRLVRLAEGFHHYYGYKRFDRALEIFQEIVADAPNDVDALSAVAYIFRRQGRIEESIEWLERAIRLDPQNAEFLSNIAQTYGAMRRYDEAIEYQNRAIALVPDNSGYYIAKSTFQTASTGETSMARETLASAPGNEKLFQVWVGLDWFDRDYAKALERLDASQPAQAFDEINLPIQYGLTYALMGDLEQAEPQLRLALARLEESAADELDAGALSGRAVVRALLGEREAALADARQAVSMSVGDRFQGPAREETLALVLTILGDHAEAVSLLEELSTQYYDSCSSPQSLGAMPFWDPLRDDPRFEALTRG